MLILNAFELIKWALQLPLKLPNRRIPINFNIACLRQLKL
jgi:hypothetical protein